MKMISVLNTKGGVGKTTIATNLATRACDDFERVGLLDIDPQRGTERWYGHRQNRPDFDPDRPAFLVGEDDPDEARDKLDRTGWDLVVVDGGASVAEKSRRAAAISDLVVIPMRTGDQDSGSTQTMVAICREAGVDYLLVINDAVSKTDKRALALQKALRGVANQPVADTIVVRRALLEDIMATGQSASEFHQKAHEAARSDIDALYAEVISAMGGK